MGHLALGRLVVLDLTGAMCGSRSLAQPPTRRMGWAGRTRTRMRRCCPDLRGAPTPRRDGYHGRARPGGRCGPRSSRRSPRVVVKPDGVLSASGHVVKSGPEGASRTRDRFCEIGEHCIAALADAASPPFPGTCRTASSVNLSVRAALALRTPPRHHAGGSPVLPMAWPGGWRGRHSGGRMLNGTSAKRVQPKNR